MYSLQNLADPKIVARERKSGWVHLAWMCKLYRKQLSEGRLFVHEHPANATSWNEEFRLEVLQHTGVSRITADQCQLGQETDKGEPIRKPTGFMSNYEDILGHLHKRCQGRGGPCSRPSGETHQLSKREKTKGDAQQPSRLSMDSPWISHGVS